jgi:enoyl-CoA hydratase
MEREMSDLVFTEKVALEAPDQFLGLITLNRPEEMNPLDWATVKALQVVLDELSADPGVRVIAFTGAGKAFSAGGDLKAYMDLYRDDEGFRGFLTDLGAVLDSLALLPQPVIALVNGYCVAGGLELMLACDLAFAGHSAQIGDGHANFGQVGGAGSNVRLPRQILPHRARELLFTGRLLNAGESLEWGLVNRAVPDDALVEAGVAFANEVAAKSPLGIGIMKEVCNRGLNMRLEDALHLEIQKVHHYCTANRDSYEGLLAFAEKRQPKFEGR